MSLPCTFVDLLTSYIIQPLASSAMKTPDPQSSGHAAALMETYENPKEIETQMPQNQQLQKINK